MNGDLESKSAGRDDLTRREVLGALALGLPAGAALAGGAVAVPGRPRIAAVVTEYRKASHGQGIVDRFLDGYGWQGRHHRPQVDVVALYVDQKPAGRPEPGASHASSWADGLSHDRRGPDQGDRKAGGRWRVAHRRARQVSPQCAGTDPLSSLRILPADRRGVPRLRSIVPGIQ